MMSLTLTASARPVVGQRATLRTKAKTARPLRAARLICNADKGQVLQDVRSIIAEQLGTDIDKVVPEARFADLGADSLDTVEILMAFEEKFDAKIDEDQASSIETVQQAADVIASKLG